MDVGSDLQAQSYQSCIDFRFLDKHPLPPIFCDQFEMHS